MKRYFVVLFLFLCSSAYSQSSINNYKYVIVPEKFVFLNANDQYSLNSATKKLLLDKGFTVYFDNNELPAEIANNRCSALNADLLDKGGMFTTNITLVLKDCKGNIVFKSKTGKSREKDYSTSYNMALKDAFTSLDQTPYAYNGSNGEPVQSTVATTAIVAPVVTEKQIPATTSAKTTTTNNPIGTLYAQAIPNGYQLVDSTPKKVLTLLKTSAENYFIASNDTVNGIVLKINEDWVFEYYSGGKLISEKLLVKF